MTKVSEKIKFWLTGNFDEETKSLIKELLENNEQELIESFYKDLEFGTGGLRGKMGVGTNRMNKYTVGLATQGLANYLKKYFKKIKEIKVVIAYDTRNNSKFFAETAAAILSNNNIKVYLFDDFRPTPELSFAIRNLKAHAGIVITASHNPKEYNGYKVYWEDGGQIVSPHDKNILEEINNLDINNLDFTPKRSKIHIIGEDIDTIYLAQLLKVSLNPQIIQENAELSILYTPLHGTGIKLIPKALNLYGFKNVQIVKEQAIPDGNFPTVKSPNPENPEALQMALEKAKELDSDIILATDPDTDRLAVAVKHKNKYILLNGNQIGSIMTYYILRNLKEKNRLAGDEYIVKTIVTTDLIKLIAQAYNINVYEVLTGFKYIARVIKEKEHTESFIGGFEESFGYLVADFVRDKDGVMAALFISEIAAWAKKEGKTLVDILNDIYIQYAFFKEKLINIVKEGINGTEEIAQIMNKYREETPAYINDTNIVLVRDYLTGIQSNLFNGEQKKIELPSSNVIQFILEDETIITVRPSGTEPKIKYYISVREKVKNYNELESVSKKLDKKIEGYLRALGI